MGHQRSEPTHPSADRYDSVGDLYVDRAANPDRPPRAYALVDVIEADASLLDRMPRALGFDR